jgi:hypothetical protein
VERCPVRSMIVGFDSYVAPTLDLHKLYAWRI